MKYVVEAQAVVGAAAEKVYALLADYREGHPRVLPPAFTGLEVEQGGVGEGTVIRVGMKAFGQVRHMRAYVTEPEPGRVLQEASPEEGIITRFFVDPISNTQSNVKLWTEIDGPDGIRGWIERKMSRRFLLGVYRQELALIDRVVQ